MNDARSPITGPSPAISVIVPVYNIERYLPACLDSLLAQTHRDFEIVVVDDGSDDGSAAIIHRYAERHPELIRPLSKPNGGLSDARNHGIDHARAAYLAFVDGDDLVAPTMLERLYACAQRSGADLVVCGIENFVDGEQQGAHYPEPDMSVFGHALAEEPRLLYRVDASACNKLYARELFERSGIRFPLGLAFEDVPTTYRLLPYAEMVAKVDEPLYRYRHARAESISGRYDHGYLDLIEGFRLVNVAYRDAGLFEVNRGPLLRLQLTHLVAGRYPDLFAHAESSSRRAFIAAAFDLLGEWFPGWVHAEECRSLWPNPILRAVSTHAILLGAFCRLPPDTYLRALRRLGSFDATR